MKYTEARDELDELLNQLCDGDTSINDFLENAVMVAEARCNVKVSKRPHTRKLCLEFWKALNESRIGAPSTRTSDRRTDMNENTGASAEMPRYKCHKEVWALKLSGVAPVNQDGTNWLYPEDKRYAGFLVSAEYMQKHKPTVGGYYVVYADGYKSFSPADAFEDGYSLIF